MFEKECVKLLDDMEPLDILRSVPQNMDLQSGQVHVVDCSKDFFCNA